MEQEKILNQAIELILIYGSKLVLAIIIWIVGFWLIKIIVNGFTRILEKRNIDVSFRPTLKAVVKILLKILLIIAILSVVGIEMTSFAAILAAAGLAVGLALSGTLQNFAGSIIILLFKPFKSGDLIETGSYLGVVTEIQIFNTILKTPDNKTIIIPNGGLSTSAMINYSVEKNRRVDWTISIGYDDDLDKARAVIQKLCDEDGRILKTPKVTISVAELADSSVNFTVRAWVNAVDYWDVFFAMNENIYKIFAKEDLNIPFPQMDIHLHKDN